jgi:hypothetical protein
MFKPAAAAGLSVASTNFGDPAATGQYSISVNFREPVSFSKLIHFLDAIESNLPKFFKTFIFENPYYEPDEDEITTDADDSAEETTPKKVGRPKKN